MATPESIAIGKERAMQQIDSVLEGLAERFELAYTPLPKFNHDPALLSLYQLQHVAEALGRLAHGLDTKTVVVGEGSDWIASPQTAVFDLMRTAEQLTEQAAGTWATVDFATDEADPVTQITANLAALLKAPLTDDERPDTQSDATPVVPPLTDDERRSLGEVDAARKPRRKGS